MTNGLAEGLARLEEVRTMLEETVREWTAEWVAVVVQDQQ